MKGDEFADALARQLEQLRELLVAERLALGGTLDLDQAARPVRTKFASVCAVESSA
ncbi:MAG: hypothetical protein WDM81_00165 [Rhizomicrobium sp.]